MFLSHPFYCPANRHSSSISSQEQKIRTSSFGFSLYPGSAWAHSDFPEQLAAVYLLIKTSKFLIRLVCFILAPGFGDTDKLNAEGNIGQITVTARSKE
jgi:hypothetical protein